MQVEGFDASLLRKQLQIKGRATVRMRGNSMAPLLPEGSRAVLRPAASDEDLLRSIVAIDYGKKVVVHRVIGKRGPTLITRGIFRRSTDKPFHKSQVIGVVCELPGRANSEAGIKLGASIMARAIRGLRSIASRSPA